MDKSLIAILLLLIPNLALAQTHTMPGSNVVPSGASLTIQSGATITAAGGSTVTGFGGGNVNNSGTPTAGQKATWVDATHIQGVTDNALQWDGGSTNLDAAAGRISLGGTIAGIALFTLAAPAGSANWIKIGSLGTITTEDAATTRTSLGLAIGTNVQAADTDLTTWAGVTPTSGIQTWLATPNSANLRGAVTDENGTGALLFNGATTPNFVTGITIDSAATGFLQGVSGSFKASAYTLPSTVIGTAGRVLYTDSTNLILSAAAYPTTAGTTGYLVRSDGTNFSSYPNQQTNSSTTNQSLSTSDVYLAGSSCVVAAGDFKQKGQYRCVFDLVKSAGTGAIVISVRIGTAGTTSDTAQLTFTFGSGTSVADSGVFDVVVNWRSVGSGTSAVVQGICRGTHNLATTGLFNNAAGWIIIGTPSGGFNSSTATTIGLSVNGSTAFSGTNSLTQAQLQQ